MILVHFIVTIFTLFSGAVVADPVDRHHYHVRGHNSNPQQHQVRRRTFGGGLMKMKHFMDWRATTKVPVGPPPTMQPTTPPTDPPTFVQPTNSPTPSPTEHPTPSPTDEPSEDCSIAFNFSTQDFGNDAFIDVIPSGLSSGDFFVFGSNGLFLDNELVGLASGRCVALPQIEDENYYYCTMEFDFGDIASVIVLQGIRFELDVVSGTGCYKDLEGFFVPRRLPVSLEAFDFFAENDIFPICTDIEPHIASPWIESEGSWEYRDWDANDRSPGDLYVVDSAVFDTDLGMGGSLEGECMTLVDTALEKRFCTMTFLTGEFPDSSLKAQGLFDNMVITAGSGCFDGLTGVIRGGTLPEGGFQYNLDLDNESSRTESSCSLDIFDEIWTEDFGGEDALAEYTGDFAPGDTFLFDNNPVSIPSRGDIGVVAGRCTLVENSSYCNIVFELGEGTIAVQGLFTQRMAIVGGSGCFQGLEGSVEGVDEDGSVLDYSWSISS